MPAPVAAVGTGLGNLLPLAAIAALGGLAILLLENDDDDDDDDDISPD